jgi:hypothetical protein
MGVRVSLAFTSKGLGVKKRRRALGPVSEAAAPGGSAAREEAGSDSEGGADSS